MEEKSLTCPHTGMNIPLRDFCVALNTVDSISLLAYCLNDLQQYFKKKKREETGRHANAG